MHSYKVLKSKICELGTINRYVFASLEEQSHLSSLTGLSNETKSNRRFGFATQTKFSQEEHLSQAKKSRSQA